MLKQISYALGSVDFLRQRQDENGGRALQLYKSARVAGKYVLFDLSGQSSIFQSPVELVTRYQVGNDDFRGFLNYQSFTLDKREKEVMQKWAKQALDATIQNPDSQLLSAYLLERKDDTHTTVLLTWWQSLAAFDRWLNSSTYEPLRQFSAPGPRNQYFFDQYHLAE